MNVRTVPAALLAGFAAAFPSSCDTYDPPPEAALLVPEGGKWFPGDPLVLTFSEPVDPETLVLDLWPTDLDLEGELVPVAAAVVEGCTPAATPCGEVSLALADDRRSASLDLGAAFDERQGLPHFVRVHPGLADDAGRVRRVETRLSFQVFPDPAAAAVEAPLETGVFAMYVDLSESVAGVYLRMFLDVGVDPATGETWIAGTVAGKVDGRPNTTQEPADFYAKLNPEGWTVFMSGTLTETAGGKLFLQTDPQDLDVLILGVIPLEMTDLQLDGTLTLGDGAGLRDSFEGTMTASGVLLDGELLPSGALVAPWFAAGLHAGELPEGLPRLCDEDPCAALTAGGGDCQLPAPWTPGPVCP